MSLTALCRSITQLHENPWLVIVGNTAIGRCLIWAIASFLIWPSSHVWWLSPLIAAFLYRPAWRRELLCLGSVSFLISSLGISTDWRDGLRIAVVVALTLGLIYGVFQVSRTFKSLPLRIQKHPLVCLHSVLWPLMLFAWALPTLVSSPWKEIIVPFRWILPLLAWRLSYLLLSGKRGSAKSTRFRDHLWYCLPGFGGTNVPYGKGYDYLQTNRVEERADIAQVQLAGIKLLILSRIWTLAKEVMDGLLYGKAESLIAGYIPELSFKLYRLTALIAGAETSLWIKWISLFAELVYFTLTLAAMGHLVIGCLRLFGYRVFRNTYKPLLADTIVEFWNRLYYYFKELLVEFFFFPVFALYFRKYPKLRMFAAVMAAAFLGNVYYHVMRDVGMLGRAGASEVLELLVPRLFYSFLLALGIFISMQREQKRRQRGPAESYRSWIKRIQGMAGVWLFYSIIHIWNVGPAGLDFGSRTQFFLSLLGV